MNALDSYFEEQRSLLAQMRGDSFGAILEVIERARRERRHIFIIGNGGSASTASHFAADLQKNTVRADLPRFRITCFNDNMAIFSAHANDDGYESVFVEPLLSHAEPGDVLIAISASGNSPNVLRAVRAANEGGLITIAFAGMAGGQLKELAQHCMVVPSQSYEHIEDVHLMLCHAIVAAVKTNPV